MLMWLKLCDFKSCFLVGFYGHVAVIYNILTWYIKTYTYMFYKIFFQAEVNEERLSYIHHCYIGLKVQGRYCVMAAESES